MQQIDKQYFCEKGRKLWGENSIDAKIVEMRVILSVAIPSDVNSLEPWFDFNSHYSCKLRELKSLNGSSSELSLSEKEEALEKMYSLIEILIKIKHTEQIAEKIEFDPVALWKKIY